MRPSREPSGDEGRSAGKGGTVGKHVSEARGEWEPCLGVSGASKGPPEMDPSWTRVQTVLDFLAKSH